MQEKEQEWPFKSFFVPLTNLKAIHIIVIVGFIVFGNMLLNGFVGDDKGYIINNQDLHTFSIQKLFGPSVFNSGSYYRPIPATYFSFLYILFQANPFFYHFAQLTLHIIVTVLIFLLFKKNFKPEISLFLSFIFLIHPIQSESVLYVAPSSGNQLLFIFGISALLLSMKEHLSSKRIVIISILLFFSLLTKETGFLFLIIVLLYRILFKENKVFVFFVFSVLISCLYFLLRFGVGEVFFTKPTLVPIARLGFEERLIHIPSVIFYYIKTLFLPLHLAIHQLWTISTINYYNFYFPLFIDIVFFLGIGLVALFVWKKYKKNFRLFIFFFCWFIVGIVLHSQLFPIDATVADRWFYFPMVGLLGVVGIVTQLINNRIRNKKVKRIGLMLGILILMVLSMRTMIRNADWKNTITLYEHDIKIHTNFDLENNLGTEYSSIKQNDKALEHYLKSVELFPYEINLSNVGNQYEQRENLAKAQEYYLRAIQKDHYIMIPQKHFLLTYVRLGYVLYLQKKFDIAKKYVQLGLDEYPKDVNLWLLLAASEYELGNQEQALLAAKKATLLLPDKKIEAIYLKILNKEPVDLREL